MKKQIIENPPNVAFVGKVEIKGELVAAIPPTYFNTGTGSIKIADEATQSKPFYHEKAALIIRTFPHLYKRVTDKSK